MVYVASLSLLAKKALGSKCYQSNLQTIIDTMPIDPAISTMDVVVLGPQDMSGQLARKVIEAVESRHPGVCVIYMCTSEKEAKLFPSAPHIKTVKRIKDDTINDAVNEFYGAEISVREQEYKSSADRVQELGKNPTPTVTAPIIPEPPELPKTPTAVEEPVLEGPPPEPDIPDTEAPRTPRAEDFIDSVKSVKDWGILKKQLDRNSIIRQLMLENNEFAGVANMLDVWDLRIREIWADPHKSSEEKFRAVEEFGHNRQVLQAAFNSTLADKFISLVERIISVCKSSAEERITEIQHAVTSIQTHKEAFLEEALSGGCDVEAELYNNMVELVAIEGELCNMVAFLQDAGQTNILQLLDEKLPSANEFINAAISVSQDVFRPENSVSIADKVLNMLTSGQVQLDAVSVHIKALMDKMFQVLVAQNQVITYQQNVITLLRANHVESLVVRDTLLKNCFHVVVGTENTGLSSTVLTYAGMLSRRSNTLVVDLTTHPHYDRYGCSVVSMDKFVTERLQEPLLVVVGDVHNDPEQTFQLLEELKSRLTYYCNLIVVLDASQVDVLDQVGREALTISYLTNCTQESLQAISDVHRASHDIPNVGRKLICIDCPIDVGTLMSTLQMDIALTQYIPLPYLREMRRAAVVHQLPHTYNDVLRVYEEAFRV